MWTSYDDRWKPAGALRGPAYFQESMITPYQAQTDVEMFDKLQKLLKTNPTMRQTLMQSGINLEKKHHDFQVGLYVLATQAYRKGDLETATTLLNRLEPIVSKKDPRLQIAVGNLKALVLYSRGLRKPAEDAFRKVFYAHRKHPLQRYVLRNLGLLMLARKDRDSAREMFRLALRIKSGYTLLRKEFDGL